MAQNCSSFKSCKEAVASYKAGNSSWTGIRTVDGIPFESICGRNGENMPQRSCQPDSLLLQLPTWEIVLLTQPLMEVHQS